MAEPHDTPGVVAPPPLIFAAGLALGIAADALLHPPATGLPALARTLLAAGLAAAGVAFALGAVTRFRRAGTNVQPYKPTTAIVSTGVYALSRNPIYVAMAMVYLAATLLLDSVACLVLLLPVLLAVRTGVIAREERYLAGKFGAPYVDYMARVRRWL